MADHLGLVFHPADGSASINLNDRQIDFTQRMIQLVSYDGLQMPMIVNETTKLSDHSGAETIYTTYNARRIMINVYISAPRASSQELLLRDLAARMSMTTGTNRPRFGKLVLTTYNDQTFEIECGLEKGLERTRSGYKGQSWLWEGTLTFFAPHPFWRSPSEMTTGSVSVDHDNGLAVPASAPFLAGSGVPGAEIDFTNPGDIETLTMEIRVNGPAVNPRWKNTKHSNFQRFNGVVPAGDTLIVRERRHPEADGVQYARLASGSNWISNRDDNAGKVYVFSGDNKLFYAQDSIVLASPNTIEVFWYAEYLSGGM